MFIGVDRIRNKGILFKVIKVFNRGIKKIQKIYWRRWKGCNIINELIFYGISNQ